MREGVTPDRRGPFSAPGIGEAVTDPPEWQSDVVFTHSLALVLDAGSSRRVDAVGGELRRAGVPVLGYHPHITLCCVDTMEGVRRTLGGLGLPRSLVLGAAVLLPDSSGVVALCPSDGVDEEHPARGRRGPAAPGPVARLRAGHRLLHERLARAGVVTFNYYGPPLWRPHVTVGYQVPRAQQDLARAILARHLPMTVGFGGITAWTVGTDEVRTLMEF